MTNVELWMLADQNKIEQYIQNKHPVFIFYNNDLGESRWLYSVQVVGTDLWLDSFTEEKDAIKFCNDNGLPIVKEIDI